MLEVATAFLAGSRFDLFGDIAVEAESDESAKARFLRVEIGEEFLFQGCQKEALREIGGSIAVFVPTQAEVAIYGRPIERDDLIERSAARVRIGLFQGENSGIAR